MFTVNIKHTKYLLEYVFHRYDSLSILVFIIISDMIWLISSNNIHTLFNCFDVICMFVFFRNIHNNFNYIILPLMVYTRFLIL